MLKKIFGFIGILLVAAAVVIAMQPAEYHVERGATVNAPPEKLFSLVNDFHNWEAWSPWARLDPQMKTTFDGPASGVGAVYRWTGNDKVGEGKMTIAESRPAEVVRIDLEFIKPFASTSSARFDFAAQGSGTHVKWTMEGKNNFISKAFSLVMDMDKMIGGDFEKGLVAMKRKAESGN